MEKTWTLMWRSVQSHKKDPTFFFTKLAGPAFKNQGFKQTCKASDGPLLQACRVDSFCSWPCLAGGGRRNIVWVEGGIISTKNQQNSKILNSHGEWRTSKKKEGGIFQARPGSKNISKQLTASRTWRGFGMVLAVPGLECYWKSESRSQTCQTT